MKLIKAIADYDDPDPDFAGLSFKKGDLIFLKNTVDKDWAEGFNISEDGKLFPLNFTDEKENNKRVKAYSVKKGSRPQGTRVESRMIRTLAQKKKRKSKKRKSKRHKSKKYKRQTKKKK